VTNVDRTARNSNLLVWHRKLWLIDHGASLYFHHSWDDYRERSRGVFAQIKDHVLLRWANEIQDVDSELAAMLTESEIARVAGLVPEAWLGDVESFPTASDHRVAYREYLMRRLEAPRAWVEEAARARFLLV
jgi:hypothetical protein